MSTLNARPPRVKRKVDTYVVFAWWSDSVDELLLAHVVFAARLILDGVLHELLTYLLRHLRLVLSADERLLDTVLHLLHLSRNLRHCRELVALQLGALQLSLLSMRSEGAQRR